MFPPELDKIGDPKENGLGSLGRAVSLCWGCGLSLLLVARYGRYAWMLNGCGQSNGIPLRWQIKMSSWRLFWTASMGAQVPTQATLLLYGDSRSQPSQRNHDQNPTGLAPLHGLDGLWVSHDRSWEAGDKKKEIKGREGATRGGKARERKRKRKILAQISKATLEESESHQRASQKPRNAFPKAHAQLSLFIIIPKKRWPKCITPHLKISAVTQDGTPTSPSHFHPPGSHHSESGEAKPPPFAMQPRLGEGMDGMVVWQQALHGSFDTL